MYYKKILIKIRIAIPPNIHLHPKLGNNNCIGNVEDKNPNDAIINIQELALCCWFSANQILYPVNGAIKQALTPTPIKILEINRPEKL